MKPASRIRLLVSAAALTLLSSIAPAPARAPMIDAAWRPPVPENSVGGFVLYQPMNDADGQVSGNPYTHNGKSYSVTTVRWTPVGFLRVEENDAEDQYLERWYMSKGDKDSTATTPPVAFVTKYFWAGRASPSNEKHADWNDLPVRFERRNDLSGTVDLEEFIAEVGSVYGFSLAATAGDFVRFDHSTSKATGY
jgi:hypothetical protein